MVTAFDATPHAEGRCLGCAPWGQLRSIGAICYEPEVYLCLPPIWASEGSRLLFFSYKLQLRPLLHCPHLPSWNGQGDHPGHSPRQLPIALLIYLQQPGDLPLTAILMGNSTVIAWGERQAFSSRKRKSAFHQTKCRCSPSMWPSRFPHVSPPPRRVWGFLYFLILWILNLGVQVILFCSSWGRLSSWGGGYSIQGMFPGASSVTRVQWQELLMGSGAAQQPVTTVDQLGVQSDNRVGQNKTRQWSPHQTKNLAGGENKKKIIILNCDPFCGHHGVGTLPTWPPSSSISVHSPHLTWYFWSLKNVSLTCVSEEMASQYHLYFCTLGKKVKTDLDPSTLFVPEVRKDHHSFTEEQRHSWLGGIRCFLHAPDLLSVSFCPLALLLSLFCRGPNIAGGKRKKWRLVDSANPSSLRSHWLSALLQAGAVRDHTPCPFQLGGGSLCWIAELARLRSLCTPRSHPRLNKIVLWKSLAEARCRRMRDPSLPPPLCCHLQAPLSSTEVPDGQRSVPGSEGRLWVCKCLFAVFPNQISIR